MDSTNNNMKDFAPKASVTSVEDIDSEDVLHMCKFCDQSFSGLYQYNIHFVAKHLKDSLKSLNQTSMDKICREMSESNHNNSSKYSSPNIPFSQKELTDNVNESQVMKLNGKEDNMFKREDLITKMNAIRSIQQRHNISSYQYDSEIIAENNLNETKTDTAYSSFATQKMKFSKQNDENNSIKPKFHAACSSDTNSTSFSEENDVKVKSGAHKYNVSFQRNNLISQSLSNIMESYSKVIGEEMELEVKIRVRPVKDNIVTHTYFNKQEIHSPHSSSIAAASSHSAYDNSVIPKNFTDFHHHRNRQIKSNVSHCLNKNIGSDFRDGFSPSGTERNALNSNERSEASDISTSLSKVFRENSENESDILIIENPYVCKCCNSTFAQKNDLSTHLCFNANKHNEDLTTKLPVKRIDGKTKNSDIFHIAEKHTGKSEPKVTIQFSCRMCKRVFYEEDKFEAHYCDDVNDMYLQSERLTKSAHHETSVTHKSQKTFSSSQSNEQRGIPSQSSEQTNSRSFPSHCVIKEIIIDDPDICIIEEPYLCEVCKKSFSHRNELDMHSCTESNKLIFPRTDKNQDLNHKKSKSNDVDLQNMEHTENSILKSKSANNNLFITEDISDNSDVHFSKSYYSCNVCHNSFTDKNELNSHTCPRAQEYSMEVDSNMKINVSLKNSTLGKRIKRPLLHGLSKNVPVNQIDETRVVYPFYCDGCDTGFFRQVDLYVHLNICDYRNNTTKETLRIFNLGKNANCHVSEQQNQKTILKSTGKEFTVTNSERDKRKIQFTHMCHKCHEGFFEKTDLELHMCTHIENNNLFCIFCNEKFLLYSKLMEHFESHRNRKLHFCFQCSKGFVEEKELKLHSANHKIRQNYTCDICKKCFELERSMKGHICKYTISKPKKRQILCELCNHPFWSKLKLKKHLDMHKKKDSLICSICSLSFEHIRTLQKHLQRHANTRPYVCLICYKGCFEKRGYVRHLTSHSEQRSYTCDICETSFAQRGHLLGHMKTHQLSPKKRRKKIQTDPV